METIQSVSSLQELEVIPLGHQIPFLPPSASFVTKQHAGLSQSYGFIGWFENVSSGGFDHSRSHQDEDQLQEGVPGTNAVVQEARIRLWVLPFNISPTPSGIALPEE